MATIEVAAIQFAPELEPAANLNRAGVWVAAAAAQGAQLVVFPEYTSAFSPRLDEQMIARAENVTDEFVAGMRQLARTHHTAIVFGLVERVSDPKKFANTVLAVDQAGEILAKYQKAHLYDAFGQKESDRVVPGKLSNPPVFEINGMMLGVQTCYDLRFPEHTRWLVDAGAQGIIIPAEWVTGPNKVHHWNTLLAARAIENTAYVIAADHPEPVGVGHSCVIDPRGVTQRVLVEGEGMVLGTFDSAEVDATREQNPSLTLRRFSVQPHPAAKMQ